MGVQPIEIKFNTVGVDGVRRDVRAVREEAGALGEQYGKAGERVAGVLAMIAHHGEVSTREMKELVREGGEMATMFGSGGAIVGGVALLGVAIFEAFSKGAEEVEKLTHKLEDLAAEHVKLMAEFRGNKLAAKEIALNEEYEKAVREIEKDAPGWGARVLAAIGWWTGSSLDPLGANERTAKGAAGISQLGVNLLQSHANAVKEDQDEQKRLADEAAKKLDEARKHAWEGAAYLAANDLSDNANFLRIIRPKWDAMWNQFSLDSEVKKSTSEIIRKMIQDTLNDSSKETAGIGTGAVTSGLAGLDALQKAAPVLSPEFWQRLHSPLQQQASQAAGQLGEFVSHEFADAIGQGLAAGVEGGFGAGAKAFEGGLGGILEMIGEKALIGMQFMTAISTAIQTFAPWIGIPAALGLIALGAEMKHAAASAVHNSGGYGGAGGSAYSSSQSSLAGQGSITVVIPKGGSFLDPNNPETMQDFVETLRKAFGLRAVTIQEIGG
jgi:peptide deformylase